MKLLLALLAACVLSVRASIPDAFKQDNFDVMRQVTGPGGGVGIEAQSRNVTLYGTDKLKSVYYLKGNASDIGFMFGELAAQGVKVLTTEWVNNIVPDLIAPSLAQKLANNTIYQWIAQALGDFITTKAVASFQEHAQAGVFPNFLLEEMQGIVAGANSVLPVSDAVTLDRIIALNYGFDWLSSQCFSGAIIHTLFSHAQEMGLGEDENLLGAIRNLQPGEIRVPAYCDAFAVTGAATASGSGSFFARDLQLPTGGVFQDYATMSIIVPDDGRFPLVTVGAPGLVGSITALNSEGLSMGVDTQRAGNINVSRPGLDSALLIRSTLHYSNSSEQATAFVQQAVRGVPYFYPMTDASGDGRVLETGEWTEAVVPAYAGGMTEKSLQPLLPSAEYLEEHSPVDYAHGVYVRNMSYRAPDAAVGAVFNPALFAHAGMLYNDSASLWGPSGSLWANWTVENENWYHLFSAYFPPQRILRDDVVLVANAAIVPQQRIAQMTFFGSLFPGEAIQWRYDTLALHITNVIDNEGGFTFEAAKDTILFLDPWNSPGYWKVRLNASDPASTLIEGALSAVDCQTKTIASKYGYFGDGWLTLTLPNYLP